MPAAMMEETDGYRNGATEEEEAPYPETATERLTRIEPRPYRPGGWPSQPVQEILKQPSQPKPWNIHLAKCENGWYMTISFLYEPGYLAVQPKHYVIKDFGEMAEILSELEGDDA